MTQDQAIIISIHVPRVGDDRSYVHISTLDHNFYPRPPCGGRLPRFHHKHLGFLISIHVPRVGDDTSPVRPKAGHEHISIHVPRVGDDLAQRRSKREQQISIHVPRVGDDRGSAPPRQKPHISIHVPRVGDDGDPARRGRPSRYFYPRPPCGGRPRLFSHSSSVPSFLSTSPVWGTTGVSEVVVILDRFLSTSPVWGTTAASPVSEPVLRISIHVPRVGDDRW